MASNYQIQEATIDDFSVLMKLYGQLQQSDPKLSSGEDRRVFEQIVAADNLHLFLLHHGADVLATTYLNIIPNITRSASPYAVIENVVTLESWRGQGLGKLIMKHTLEFAWQKRCYKAMLLTGSKEPGTHAFYRSCGFDGDAKHGYIARP